MREQCATPGAGWHKLDLGDGMLAQLPLQEIAVRFDCLYPDPGKVGAAVYLLHESEGRLHCSVQAYFSPGAMALAQEYSAIASVAPAMLESLELLCGATGSGASM